jgi:endoglucanase
MKKKLGLSIFFVALCVMTLFAQADPRPAAPQPMSSKTAMEYFRDEGITVGINMGNTLDAVGVSGERAWGNIPANQAYFDGIKAQGFNIVRIPVTWNWHIGPAPDYIIEEAWLQRVAEVAGYARNAGLKAFINIHHDGQHNLGGWLLLERAARDTTITDKFEKVWKQIAEYFVNYGDWLMFQGFNEIHSGDWGQGTAAQYIIINDWNQRFTNAVRSTGGNNALRYLIYYGYNTSYTIADARSPFRLPTDTAAGRQIVAFHYYQPLPFVLFVTTHNWGTRSDRNAINAVFRNFKTRFIDNNIPVIIGENGPARYVNYRGNSGYNASNVETARTNRLAYVDHFYTSARANGLVACYWENGVYSSTEEGDFSLINRSNGQPNSPESAEVIRRMIAASN